VLLAWGREARRRPLAAIRRIISVRSPGTFETSGVPQGFFRSLAVGLTRQNAEMRWRRLVMVGAARAFIWTLANGLLGPLMSHKRDGVGQAPCDHDSTLALRT
jgi:hypothetical protein